MRCKIVHGSAATLPYKGSVLLGCRVGVVVLSEVESSVVDPFGAAFSRCASPSSVRFSSGKEDDPITVIASAEEGHATGVERGTVSS